MILFIDRLPLYSWVDPIHQPTLRRWSVSVPALMTRPTLKQPPADQKPRLGVRALLRAGLRVKIDFGRATVSVWVPGAWYRQLAVTARRCLNGFRTLPVVW